jgi:signal transduction histidine kinase
MKNADPGPPMRILLVEDSPSDADLLCEGLQQDNARLFEVTVVTHLASALDQLESRPFDAVLLDLSLPDSYGLQTLVRLHQAVPRVPIVVLTGLNDEATAIEAARQGAEDYLVKGQTGPPLLVRSIRYAIERKRIEEALRKAHDELELRVRERTQELVQMNSVLQAEILERRRMETEILAIGEKEQQRIGRDLHDGLSQQLAGIAYLSNALTRSLETESSPSTAEARRINQLLDEAISQAHGLAHGLHPVKLEANGLMSALSELATRVTDIYRVTCRFVCRSPVLIQDNSTAMHLYRIAQEAVHNALKHGKPSRVTIQLANCAHRVVLTVKDNGSGAPPNFKSGWGMGLKTMSYRARTMGGVLDLKPVPKGGTALTCTVPFDMNLRPGNHDENEKDA